MQSPVLTCANSCTEGETEGGRERAHLDPGLHTTYPPTTPPFLDTPGPFSNGPTSFSLLPRRPRSKV
ncbi:hypothetical protein Q5P01_011409 [Channa striata]|uniref:Uncharacterized protein n=1 Tax=Channa striata TaxID=64152 RepID=A0AA88SMV4_CHASR|nr:hypothetical protein Q5P01_011409 [Channa striata]